MNLYQIDELIKLAIEKGISIDEETGLVTEFNTIELGKLELSLENKIENVGLYIKNIEAFEESLKNEQDNLQNRRKTLQAKSEYLRNYLSNYLLRNQKDKFETSKLKLSFRKSEVVTVADTFNNKDYLRIKTEIDKQKLKTDLKSGMQIDGAGIVEKQNLQIK